MRAFRTIVACALLFALVPPGFAAVSAKRKSTSSTKRSSKAFTKKKVTRFRGQLSPTTERYMEIQRALAEKGFYQGPIDGEWKADCVEALKRFQEAEHLKVDGKLGARSIIALGLGPKHGDSVPTPEEIRDMQQN